jgi:hypothetical protein
MKIQVNSDKNVMVDAGLSASVASELTRAFEKFQAHITRVEVHLSDLNSGKSGPRDKRCKLEVRPEGRKPVSVSFDAATVDQALRGAAGKMKRLLQTSYGKIADRVTRGSGPPGKRGPAPRITLENLGRIEAVLSEVLEGSADEHPQVEKHAKAASDAMKKIRSLIEARDTKAPAKSTAAERAKAPSGSVAGRSVKKKGIFRARRKSWPSR